MRYFKKRKDINDFYILNASIDKLLFNVMCTEMFIKLCIQKKCTLSKNNYIDLSF